MIDALGVITNKPDHLILEELTKYRNINTLPIGGKYKLIDFPLSNMVNTGMKKIGVIGNHRYKSLVEHLGTGQEWSLNRKNKGLSVLHGANYLFFDEFPTINLMDFHANIEFFEQTSRNSIIISSSHVISKVDYDKVLEEHRQQGADITLIYSPEVDVCSTKDDLYLNLDASNSWVAGISEDPSTDHKGVFLDMLIINRQLLLKLIEECDRHNLNWDLMKLLQYNTGRFKISAYPYKGYFCKISSVSQYFKCSMDFLNPVIKKEIFNEEHKIHTNVKDNHPTRYGYTGEVNNSLIASGCLLEGQINSSIIFRKVHVQSDSQIKRSIIMDRCQIGRHVHLENVIIDRNVTIKDHIVLKGREDAPIVIGKGRIIG
ncbi:glucose-1-phosphate adenylyltransferase subunit GlgD [Vallitalea okinawensis]|uniref:glucose-1-phosphate adenylyltransferase subunit GlgD n=1 Tax=Vallitalea okinawensis TaxID=2078660 RepID=UPI000CFD9D84|nr:glucose-1-phosphate adenylyltransferase subunit GlgD [Vallitalea okinawensis]